MSGAAWRRCSNSRRDQEVSSHDDEVDQALAHEWVKGIRELVMGYYGASHAKMLAYHPDRVANLAEEFQELAHQKTIEIRASYEALLRIVG